MSHPGLNITILQPDIVWENKQANLQQYEKMLDGIEEKKEVVVLPEMFSTGFCMKPETLAESMNGATVKWMKETAAANKIILAGSAIIEEGGHYFNRLIWMQPDGIFYHYDKRHLFAYAGEDEKYTPGNSRLIVSVKGWKICLMVCYDLRFPVWSRNSLPPAPSNGGGVPPEQDYFEDADPALYGKLKEYMLLYRKNPTKAEQILWETLRGKQLEGYKFKRQHIIGQYIADFVCLSKKLVIEVDGLIHQLPEHKENDEQRTEWLNSKGYTVVRITNDQVINQHPQTLEKIVTTLKLLPLAERKIYGHSSQVGGGREGAFDILIYAANWPERRILAWKTLLQARAIENMCYVVGINRVGADGNNIQYCGDSLVFGPLGETLLHKGNEAGTGTITLDKEHLIKTRTDLPFLLDGDRFAIL